MSIGVGGFFPSGIGQAVYPRANAKGYSRKLELGEYRPEQSLAEKLAEAVEEYKEKLARGLNALTEDEINTRIEDFIARYKPDPESATEYEMQQFIKMLAVFVERLQEMAQGERLLVTGAEAAAKDEHDSVAEYIRTQMVSRSPQSQGQTGADISRISAQDVQKMAGRYEQMVPVMYTTEGVTS